MLGIVIGIASVIVLMSIGASAQDLILDQVKGTGSNLIFIIPGGSSGSRFSSPASVQGIIIKTLVTQDTNSLSREASIAHVAPEVRGQARMIYGNNDVSVTYEGTTQDFFLVRNFNVIAGRTFTATDVQSFNHVAVLGNSTAKNLFGDLDPIGKIVRLRDTNFLVIGVLEKKGLGPGGIDQDATAIVPISVAQKQLLGIDYYSMITVQADDSYNIDFVKGRITQVLRQNHSITDPNKDDFTIRTQEDALSLLGNITSILTLFLTSIACISLIVGGIGIMNIMYVSVVERTKEIGLRKSIGATGGDILQQFLWEAVILTLLGGIIGIIVGSTVTVLVYLGVTAFAGIDWVFELPLQAIALAAGVSSLTGLVFGIYPAYKASKLSPTEALRYE